MINAQDLDVDGDLNLEVESLAIGSIDYNGGVGFLTDIDTKGFVTPSNSKDPGNRLLLKGVEERDEECISKWVMGNMDEFWSFLGLSYDGFEEEARELFCLIERNWNKDGGVGDASSVECKRLRCELRKLDNGINYDRSDAYSSQGGWRVEKVRD